MKLILVALLILASAKRAALAEDRALVVLGHLEAKDYAVTIYAGEKALFSVRTKKGQVLADKITASELRARFPELHRINDATTVAWAGF